MGSRVEASDFLSFFRRSWRRVSTCFGVHRGRRILSSEDTEKGHEFWKPGVYSSPQLWCAYGYCRAADLFSEDVLLACALHLRSKPDKKRTGKSKATQFVTEDPETVEITSLLVQVGHRLNIDKGMEEFIPLYNPMLEAAPVPSASARVLETSQSSQDPTGTVPVQFPFPCPRPPPPPSIDVSAQSPMHQTRAPGDARSLPPPPPPGLDVPVQVFTSPPPPPADVSAQSPMHHSRAADNARGLAPLPPPRLDVPAQVCTQHPHAAAVALRTPMPPPPPAAVSAHSSMHHARAAEHAWEPLPQRRPADLHEEDGRFNPKVRERHIRCDGCWSWKSQHVGIIDGAYHEVCALPYWLQWDTRTAQLAYMERQYWNGHWNASWSCSFCWGEWYGTSVHEARERLGLNASFDQEFDRKRRRTTNVHRRSGGK